MDKVAFWAGFLLVLLFPLPVLILPSAPNSSISRGWYNRLNSGRRTKWIHSRPTPKKLKIKKARHTVR
jgi:hypothetical protein